MSMLAGPPRKALMNLQCGAQGVSGVLKQGPADDVLEGVFGFLGLFVKADEDLGQGINDAVLFEVLAKVLFLLVDLQTMGAVEQVDQPWRSPGVPERT